MTDKDIVYTSDRVIAGASLLFFILSVGINFTIAKRLFDRRLALLGMGLILVCNVFWNFSLTGLPQMLMLLIFSLVNYCLVRAIENREAGEELRSSGSALSGVGFGLLVLAHGLAIWIFIGALVYMAFAFLPAGGRVVDARPPASRSGFPSSSSSRWKARGCCAFIVSPAIPSASPSIPASANCSARSPR